MQELHPMAKRPRTAAFKYTHTSRDKACHCLYKENFVTPAEITQKNTPFDFPNATLYTKSGYKE